MLVPKPLEAYLREKCQRNSRGSHQKLLLDEENLENNGIVQIEMQIQQV